uniref:Uncharacterized protein n=1 Tax=Anguilla anguilla TaxID=7936 RepID=A0A0E9XJV5_ANGAN
MAYECHFEHFCISLHIIKDKKKTPHTHTAITRPFLPWLAINPSLTGIIEWTGAPDLWKTCTGVLLRNSPIHPSEKPWSVQSASYSNSPLRTHKVSSRKPTCLFA